MTSPRSAGRRLPRGCAGGAGKDALGNVSLKILQPNVPFSCPGAEFTQSLEVTFYPGEEKVHITQTAEGLGPDNYLSLKTHIEGQVPFLPENVTVHIAPYKELYHYSSSGRSPCSPPCSASCIPIAACPHLELPKTTTVPNIRETPMLKPVFPPLIPWGFSCCPAAVMSSAHREYVLAAGTANHTLSYRLHQNITLAGCPHARLPARQRLSVTRAFALYDGHEHVLRYALAARVGSAPGELRPGDAAGPPPAPRGCSIARFAQKQPKKRGLGRLQEGWYQVHGRGCLRGMRVQR